MLGHHLRHYRASLVVSTQRGVAQSQIPRGQSPPRWCRHQDEFPPWRLSPHGTNEQECTEKREINKSHAHKERLPLATPRECAREQPLPPSTGLLQFKKCQPSQSEEKRQTTGGQLAPYRTHCGKHEETEAPACPAPGVHERTSTHALFGRRILICRPCRPVDSSSAPYRS